MSIAGFDPETAGNHEEIEQQFAVKTVEHLEVRSWILFLYLLLTASPLRCPFLCLSIALPSLD